MSRHTVVQLAWLRLFSVMCFARHHLARLLSRDPALLGLGVHQRDREERRWREEHAVACHTALVVARRGN